MKVFIRSDASVQMGAGHVMRCLALAEGFREQGLRPIFLTRTEEPLYLAAIRQRGFSWVRIPKSVEIRDEPRAMVELECDETVAGLVVDYYDLPRDYFAQIRSLRPKWALVYIDDWCKFFEGVNLIVNQNIYAKESDWSCRDTRRSFTVLAGPKYALLRSEFRRRAPGSSRRQGEVSKILLTLGGNDLANHTLRILKALDQFEIKAEMHIVLGPGFRHSGEIATFASGRPYFRIWSHVSDMRELMGQMDLSINGSGSTLWELYYMGLPNIIYVLADNQARVAERAHELGCSVSLGPIEKFDPEALHRELKKMINSPQARESMSKKVRQVVDGLGVDRVTRTFLSLCRKEVTGASTSV